jgi:hypothetical protein
MNKAVTGTNVAANMNNLPIKWATSVSYAHASVDLKVCSCPVYLSPYLGEHDYRTPLLELVHKLLHAGKWRVAMVSIDACT